MTIANGSFEIAGSAPGLAHLWTSTFVSTAEEWADFAQNPSDATTLSRESFDKGWAGLANQIFVGVFVGETVDTEAAIFNVGPGQTPVERFDVGWGTPFLVGLTSSQFATFAGSGEVETFAAGWGTVAFALPSDSAAASFDSRAVESFEENWKDNDTFSDDLGSFSTAAAVFDGEALEDFDDVLAPIAFTAVAATDVMTLATAPSVALSDGESVFVSQEDGTLPDPLEPDQTYFLRDVVGSTFKLASYSGGAALDITTMGTGAHYLHRDPASWWSRLMITPL